MRHTAEPLSLGALLREIDGLRFLVERLNSRVVADDKSSRDEIMAKLTRAREQLAEIIVQRSV